MSEAILQGNGKEVVEFKGSFWLKVFYHDYVEKALFEDENEALSSNNSQKYSILGSINNKMRIAGKFEFILYYPTLDAYFQWQQRRNPLEDIETSERKTAHGFKLIYSSVNETNFKGLVKTNLNSTTNHKINTLLNGTPGQTNWLFAVGMYACVSDYAKYYNKGFPYYLPDPTDKVSLWLKIGGDLSDCARTFQVSQRMISNVFVYVLLVTS